MSKALTPAQAIKGSLQKMETEFAKALPSHIDPKKFVRVAQTAITSNPALLKCDKTSLFAACTRAAEIGLLPNGIEAALVPFGSKVNFMSMIAGKMKLARNSGEIKTLDSQIIHKNDEFSYVITEDGPKLSFQPNFLGDRGDVIGAFAMGVTKDGGVYIEVMSNEQITAIEKQSKGNNTPWKGPFRSEMIRKSVMNRLLKRMPTSTDIDMDTENDYEMQATIETPPVEEVVHEEKEVKDTMQPARLAELVEDESAPEVPL